MTLGEKLKQIRKNACLSQEQMAEKLCVSRQAISKWESDRGMPDIDNLQSIAKLFGVSIDLLLENDEVMSNSLKEEIDLTEYEKTGKCRSKYDAVVKDKYANATTIYPLIRRKRLSKWEWIVDFVVQPGVLAIADSLNDLTAYYLVETQNKQILVNVSKEYIESKELNCKFNGKKRIIGNNLFIKATYTIN